MIGSLRGHQAAELLPNVAAPTLICAGAKDLFAPLSVQRRMHELIPDSELLVFEEGGHMLPAEEPEPIAAAMVDFLDRRVSHPALEGRDSLS